MFKLRKRFKFAKCKEGRIEVMENLEKGQVSERNVMEDAGIMLNLLFSDYQNAWWIMCVLRSYSEMQNFYIHSF